MRHCQHILLRVGCTLQHHRQSTHLHPKFCIVVLLHDLGRMQAPIASTDLWYLVEELLLSTPTQMSRILGSNESRPDMPDRGYSTQNSEEDQQFDCFCAGKMAPSFVYRVQEELDAFARF